jgi:hypothetical protein
VSTLTFQAYIYEVVSSFVEIDDKLGEIGTKTEKGNKQEAFYW